MPSQAGGGGSALPSRPTGPRTCKDMVRKMEFSRPNLRSQECHVMMVLEGLEREGGFVKLQCWKSEKQVDTNVVCDTQPHMVLHLHQFTS